MKMKLDQFDFDLPEELIAKYPAEHRDESRLMVVDRKTGKIAHKRFKDIIDYFEPKDVLVTNNTKVFPARLHGYKEKTGAAIEVFLLRELNPDTRLWDVLVDPARKIRVGNKLYFEEDQSLVAEVIDNTVSRGRILRFLYDGPYEEFRKKLYNLGQTPLPKEIKRAVEPDDAERYQTIFAKKEGAVVPPTAGLHFSKHLLKRLEIKGVKRVDINLNLSLGAFEPVEVQDLAKHQLPSEEGEITQEAADIINKAKLGKHKVCAVGTATMRPLETAVSTNGELNSFKGWTHKFIFPPYECKIANCMIANFHLPKSILLMMVAAFMGHDLMMEAYDEAIKEKYNFFSYGDAMLIL